MKTTGLLLAFSMSLFAGLVSVSNAAESSPKSGKPKLYDTGSDGKEQIVAALKTAKAEDKRVILKFGADW